jgi:hypothetical protein
VCLIRGRQSAAVPSRQHFLERLGQPCVFVLNVDSYAAAGREALVGTILLVKDNAGATLFRMPLIDHGE